MKTNTCIYNNQKYVLLRSSELYEAISKISESFGVFADYGRGTDAYIPIGLKLIVDGDDLILDEIQISATGDCYFQIGGVAPQMPENGRRGEATYNNLGVVIKNTGTLNLLMKNQLHDSSDESECGCAGDYEQILELEFIGGKLLRDGLGNDDLVERRELLACSSLRGIDQSQWTDLGRWMCECVVVERSPDEHRAYLSAINSGTHILDCLAKFPGVRKLPWSEREMALVNNAAKGIVEKHNALELLHLFERATEMHVLKERDNELDELLVRGKAFWKDVDAWMAADLEKRHLPLHKVVQRLAGTNKDADLGGVKSLPALVYEFEKWRTSAAGQPI